MQNFNTNQTRHFYAAKALGSGTDYNAFNNGDIAFASTEDKKAGYFIFKNHDGLLTRTDVVDPKNVVSVKVATTKASASSPFKSMARPLLMQELEVDTNKITFGASPVLAGTSESLIGKCFTITVNVMGVFDYDMSNNLPIVASVVGNATNLASAYAFIKAVADAIVLAQPQNDPQYPFIRVFYNGNEVTKASKASSSAATVTKCYLVQGPQRYVRGKLSGEPCPFSVSSNLTVANLEDIFWLKETDQTVSNISGFTVVAGARELADLEYFALGERGDVYRGYLYPNEYDTHYEIDPSGTTEYNVLSIEYFWQGGAENVQKSPRLLEIAAPASNSNDVITELYESFEAFLNGVASS